MDLEIIEIHEQGKQNSEYVELMAMASCDLKYYMVVDQTYSLDMSISNKLRNTYWFKPKLVKIGDLIFLRTGKGKDSADRNTFGTTTYIFYWGLDKPVWNNTGDKAVLVRIRETKVKTA